jgi:hypothetical protein
LYVPLIGKPSMKLSSRVIVWVFHVSFIEPEREFINVVGQDASGWHDDKRHAIRA